MVPIAKAFHSHQSRLALLLKYIRMALCVVNWLNPNALILPWICKLNLDGFVVVANNTAEIAALDC
jgi:hypothetical protein